MILCNYIQNLKFCKFHRAYVIPALSVGAGIHARTLKYGFPPEFIPYLMRDENDVTTE